MMKRKFLDIGVVKYLVLILLGIFLLITPIKKDITQEQAGWALIIIGALAAIGEGFLLYDTKLRKSGEENIKSKGEQFIADYLKKKKIKFIYEKKLKVGKETLKPDFYLPEFDVYVEYWGRWDTDFEYRKECHHKKKLYEEYEIKLVEIYPDNLVSLSQLDWKFTERLLDLLKQR